jgi:hypothetical protein
MVPSNYLLHEFSCLYLQYGYFAVAAENTLSIRVRFGNTAFSF